MRMLLIALAILFASPVSAQNWVCEGNPHECGGGIVGPQGEQGEQGEQGPPGADGQDGADGADGQDGLDGQDGTNGIDGQDGADGQDGQDGSAGVDGINGTNGIDGRDGVSGRDGVVSETWINETRNWQSKWLHYAAADNAIQVYLPQDQDQRVTFGVAQIHGTTGYSVGYAYKTDRKDNLAFTLGIGTSGGQQVGKASVGFEFGGRSGPSHKHQYTCSYVSGELNAETDDAQDCD